MTDGERGILKPMFCRQCGNRAEGTAFCVDCGAPVQAESPWMATIAVGSSAWGFGWVRWGCPLMRGVIRWTVVPVPTPGYTAGWKGATSSRPDPTATIKSVLISIRGQVLTSTRAVKLGAAALVFAVLVGGVATALLLLGSSKDASSYRAQAGRLVSPVSPTLPRSHRPFKPLSPGGDPQAAQNAIATAPECDTGGPAVPRPAQAGRVPGFRSPAQVNAALTSEVTWLQTASAVLASPSSPLLSQLSGMDLTRPQSFSRWKPISYLVAMPPSPRRPR